LKPVSDGLPLTLHEQLLFRQKSLGAVVDAYLISKPRRLWHSTRWKRQRKPGTLYAHEWKKYSQNGEDGIIAEIMRRIGAGGKYLIEFGIEDGTECCTRRLLVEDGWGGLLIDGSPEYAEKARKMHAGQPTVQVVNSFITVENILDVFREAQVPHAPDLLVVDIDGNDYWIWNRILSAYRPRVVVIEYNARWLPPTEWVMSYSPTHCWDGTAQFGASLSSLAKLGSAHGYKLVGCTSDGVNAFFVRDDLVGDHFPDHDNGVAYHYAPPLYGRGFGHPISKIPANSPLRVAKEKVTNRAGRRR
jgi:hypothetical protein